MASVFRRGDAGAEDPERRAVSGQPKRRRLRKPTFQWPRRVGQDPARDPSLPSSTGYMPPSAPEQAPRVSESVQLLAFDPRWLRRSVIAILVILTIYQLAVWLFHATGHFLFLMLLAWLAAIAMEPPIRFFERHGMSRGLGTGITMLAGLLGTMVALVMLGGVFSSQLAELIDSVPTLVTDVVDQLNERFGLHLNPNEITSQLNLDASTVASFATDFAGGIFGAIGVAFAVIFDTLTVLVFAFYVAADGPRLRRTIASWLPPRHQRVLVTVWDISLAKTGGFVVSKLILAGLSSVAHAGFFWVIDLPFWLPLGVFAGFTAQLIPTIGTYIGVAVPVLIALLEDPIDALWIVAFATVYQQIENYVFTPKVSRATMHIHAAVALAAVFIGAALWGPIGALIGIPLAAAVIAVLDTYGNRYELIAEMSDGTPAAGLDADEPDAEPRQDVALPGF
ncbi:MAG: AI-2E family transporter [Candidatus Nanopelagicales bacterium]|nr:AI-2E family transporter [Candidatus Nanopelagicales bacterium]MDZ4249179.1 AI-2E family transporter [Candidatus Nanopelagicales bacterium]